MRSNANKNALAEYCHPYDFVKEKKSHASCFPINSHIFTRIDLRKENERSLFGKISLFRAVLNKTLVVDKDCGLWTGTTLGAH